MLLLTCQLKSIPASNPSSCQPPFRGSDWNVSQSLGKCRKDQRKSSRLECQRRGEFRQSGQKLIRIFARMPTVSDHAIAYLSLPCLLGCWFFRFRWGRRADANELLRRFHNQLWRPCAIKMMKLITYCQYNWGRRVGRYWQSTELEFKWWHFSCRSNNLRLDSE